MTRGECLDWLHRLRGEIYVYIQPKEWLIPMNNALDMAIKALEQEPSEDMTIAYLMGYYADKEPCEDCISRSSIKQKLQKHRDFFTKAYSGYSYLPQNDKSRVDEITNCISMVVNEPPVTPQSKTVLYSGDGYADGYIVYDMAECPNCGYKYEDGDKDWGLPFCPNCGQSLDWESEDKE